MGWPVVAASLTLVALAVALAGWLGLRIGRDLVVSSVRAAVQLIAVGLLFALIFASSGATWWSWAWVVAMAIVATFVVLRRADDRVAGLGLVVGIAVLGSTTVSLAVTFGFGVIEFEPVSLVVVAGITVGNAVPTAVLGVNQSIELSRDRVGQTEALLSLGFDRRQVLAFMAPRPARSALIPQVERTKVVGLIALPGAMTGLLLAGVDPLQAVVIQLLVMYLVLGAAAVCVVGVVSFLVMASVSPDLRVAEWSRRGGAETPGRSPRRGRKDR